MLAALFEVDWSDWPFIVEHGAKSFALMQTIVAVLEALAAIWKLSGGSARAYVVAGLVSAQSRNPYRIPLAGERGHAALVER